MSESYGYSTYFNLVDSKGNNLSQHYASDGFYYGTSQPQFQYYFDKNRNLRSSSSDLLCAIQTPGNAYTYFTQNCQAYGITTAVCTIASGNLQCADSSGKQFFFGEYQDGHIISSQGTNAVWNPVTVMVSPASR